MEALSPKDRIIVALDVDTLDATLFTVHASAGVLGMRKADQDEGRRRRRASGRGSFHSSSGQNEA